jgi:hypothetical protein
MDETTQRDLEAAAFRRLVAHLSNAHRCAEHRSDGAGRVLPQLPVQLAGGCGAQEAGVDLDKAGAREMVYGMPYDAWKATHQPEATPEQWPLFKKRRPSTPTDLLKNGLVPSLLATIHGIDPWRG